VICRREDFITTPENYREKEPLYNAGSGNTYTGMAGNTLAGITGNTYSGMTGNATPEYAFSPSSDGGFGHRVRFRHQVTVILDIMSDFEVR